MTRRILFVCLGNICRSPLAEGIFQQLVAEAGLDREYDIDSAGTGPWHVGKPPDPRSIEIAAEHGIDISSQRARRISLQDFNSFDVILAMDSENLAALNALATDPRADVRLFLNAPPRNVPDPFFGGAEGFEDVYRLIRSGCERLLETLCRNPDKR